MTRSLTALSLLLAALAGCGPAPIAVPDGGAGSYTLQRIGAAALGLRYGEVRPLSVRYLDDHGQPIAGAVIRFGIFDDPKGSTLSADQPVTLADGTATVSVTGGAAEAEFRVVATANNSSDVEFDISVSKFAFVEIDISLAYTGANAAKVQSTQALLFNNRTCADLHPEVPLSGWFRAMSSPGAASTIPFTFLLGVSYAVVGRALGAGGVPLAFGCVDVNQSQLGKSSLLLVPVPLVRIIPSAAGSWALTSHLALSWNGVPSPVKVWDDLAHCPAAPAQQILDGVMAATGGVIATAMALRRGPFDASGCRPVAQQGIATLDAQLNALLAAPPGSPTSALPQIVADLDAVVARADLSSTLDLTASDAGYFATHRLGQIQLSGTSGAKATYDLPQSGYPIVVASGVPALLAGGMLSLGDHGFTLRLPLLWGRAFGDVALAPRGLPPDVRAFLQSLVDAATRAGDNQTLKGCDAVEDLVCKQIGLTPCALSAACSAALDALAIKLQGPFRPPSGIDLTLSGSATALDADGNLQVDKLTAGVWNAQVLVAAPSLKLPAVMTWSGARAH